MRSLICTFALVAVSAVSAISLDGLQAGNAVPASCGSGKVNTIPVTTQDPTFVQAIMNGTVTNGKLYQAGQGNDTFKILHVYGSPYEQGFANGKANADNLKNLWTNFQIYLDDMLIKALKGDKISLPKWLYELLDKYGVGPLLDWSWDNVKAFTPQRYVDEMQGLADGAGIDVQHVIRVNMFPEISRAACTIVGASKTATPNGKIAHLRALDFGPHMPIRDYPQITVYHQEGEPAVANFGWSGLIGSLTGISDTTISIGEKVWYPPGKRSIIFNNVSGWHGQPWMFILRDVLMTKNIEDALGTIQKANKTCAIHVGVGDSTTNTFRGVTMAKKAFNVYNSSTDAGYPGHPMLDHVTYWDKFLQPSSNACLGDLLKQNYGKLDAEMLALTVAPVSETGEMHTVSFDLGGQMAYFANARKSTADGVGALNSYDRQFTLVNLTKLWNEKQ